MPKILPTLWLSLLLLLCSLGHSTPALALGAGTSCLAAWNDGDCPQPCALAALQPKAAPCPSCHHHPGPPLPLKQGGELLSLGKRPDQSVFATFLGRPGQRGRQSPPPELLSPRRPLLPNQILASLRTVVLRN
jgi:hypothetical protein